MRTLIGENRPVYPIILDPKNQNKMQKRRARVVICSHEIEQLDGEVAWLSEMVGAIEGMGKPGQDS